MIEKIKKLFYYVEKKFARTNRVYIIPTKFGLTYITINSAIFLMALFYANNLTLLITFFLVSYFVIVMISTNNDILNLTIKSIKIEDHFANETPNSYLYTNLDKTLENLEINMLEQRFTLNQNTSLNNLGFKITSLKRGKYSLGKIKISHLSPSGLFYAWKYFDIPCEFFIYPKKIRTPLIENSNSNKSHFIKNDEFSHHILYKDGFSANRIDWKVYAKTDELYWKETESIRSDYYHFNLSQIDGDLETKLSKLSYLVAEAFYKKAKWSLKVYNSFYPLSNDKDHLVKSLQALSVVKDE